MDRGNWPALMALLNLLCKLDATGKRKCKKSLWRFRSRFHVRGLCIRKARIVADGEGALSTQCRLDAVDNENGMVLLGQLPCCVIEIALQALSWLSLAHHRFHVQRFDVHLMFFGSFECGFEGFDVVGDNNEWKVAISVLETREVLFVRFSAAVAESSSTVTGEKLDQRI
jgi:hypothetical protein